MAAIKNIIFDFGGIFINIDYQKTEDAFINLGIKNFAEYYKQDFVSKLFEDLEIGVITPLQFYDGFRQITNASLTNEQIENAWNALLGEYLLDRLEWLHTIKENYKIFLFSNTNKIHYDRFIKMYRNLKLPNSFSSYFIKDYYSHVLGLRKPNANSYNAILKEQGLLAGETIFIDDTLKNIEGAKAVGLQTLHLTIEMDLATEMNKLLTIL